MNKPPALETWRFRAEKIALATKTCANRHNTCGLIIVHYERHISSCLGHGNHFVLSQDDSAPGLVVLTTGILVDPREDLELIPVNDDR